MSRQGRRHASLLYLLSSPRPVRIPVPSQLQDAVIFNLGTLCLSDRHLPPMLYLARAPVSMPACRDQKQDVKAFLCHPRAGRVL